MQAICRNKRLGDEMRFFKICLLLICFIGLLTLLKGETCNGGLDLCQPSSECNAYSQMVNIPYKKLRWCDVDNYIVCCPQVRSHITPKPVIESRVFQKECKKWQELVYNRTCPPEGLISQGTNAVAQEFPHMALIGTLEDYKYDWFCGGSLISPKFVVTAAHCILRDGGTPTRVRLGEVNYASTDDNAVIQEFTIKNFTVHPKYQPPVQYFDIALMELNDEAIINKNVVPICLPTTNGSEHARLYAAGWGALGFAAERSKHLQKVILERFSDRKCRQKTGTDRTYFPRGVNVTSQICAGSTFDHRETCEADSGCPLFIEHQHHACMFEIQGITSFGTVRCGTPGSPGVYTRVLPFVDWIESIVWNDNKVD